MDGKNNTQKDGWKEQYRKMDGKNNTQKDGWKEQYRKMDGKNNTQKDGWKEQYTERWMDGKMDGTSTMNGWMGLDLVRPHYSLKQIGVLFKYHGIWIC